jgi:hypothetical protein
MQACELGLKGKPLTLVSLPAAPVLGAYHCCCAQRFMIVSPRPRLEQANTSFRPQRGVINHTGLATVFSTNSSIGRGRVAIAASAFAAPHDPHPLLRALTARSFDSEL